MPDFNGNREIADVVNIHILPSSITLTIVLRRSTRVY